MSGYAYEKTIFKKHFKVEKERKKKIKKSREVIGLKNNFIFSKPPFELDDSIIPTSYCGIYYNIYCLETYVDQRGDEFITKWRAREVCIRENKYGYFQL